jgi:tetratricopeptide (TPR) repeat protein
MMIRFHLAVALLAAALPAFADSSACHERTNAGDIPGTISACSAALESNPEDANAWANRGYAHGHSGKHDQAMIDFDRALGIDPRLVSALDGRAQLHSATRNHAAALTDLTTALAIEPRNSRLLAMAAQVSHNLGQKKETITFMERATKADPQNPELWLSLASLHDDDLKKKENILDKAVKASSSDHRALHTRGHFHEDGKKLGKAADDFRAASRISPNESHLYGDLARTLLAQNKNDAAMAVLDQGLAVKSDARLLNQRLPLRLAAGNPLGAADDLRAWFELGKSPQAERLQEPINVALYELYAPGLQSALGDTEKLQPTALDCGVSESTAAWLEALSAADGKVATAREDLAPADHRRQQRLGLGKRTTADRLPGLSPARRSMQATRRGHPAASLWIARSTASARGNRIVPPTGGCGAQTCGSRYCLGGD